MMNVLYYLEKSCERNPDKTAVSMKDTSITYRELRASARRLGTVLSTVGKDQPIGVFANRTIEPAAHFLAVLYSGNFYVPLDPDMPAEKLQAILNDAQFKMILGGEENWKTIEGLCFSGEFITTRDQTCTECAFPDVGDDSPIYMVYTSGSTGKPKGVIKSHRAVCCYIEAFCKKFPVMADEVIGNQTPFFFDASAKDFYLMLKTGATLDIIPTELFSMPTMLMEYMNEKKITFASWVPTALSIVAQLNPFSLVKPEYLRRMFFVGEVMPMKHLNKWRSALPELQYINLYGQSEISGVCCYYEVKGEYADSDILPMGKALSNCNIYLISEGQIVTEPNVLGEMYIVSPSLALGYYHDEEKTEQNFLMKDFGNGLERCFKTGDVAQYDSEGNLVFSTRTDFQIKHMGHRIELGEIEAVANALPGMQRCCCLYQAEKRKIVLFCELESDVPSSSQEIQSALRRKLSNYMVPGKVVILDRLPVNANGKIDRQKIKENL